MCIRDRLQTALCEIQAGRPAMLVSIVRSTGSTPRKAGALMLVGENGLLCGTIGGGLLEHRCLAIASSALTVPRCEAFVLDNRQAGSLGMVCGCLLYTSRTAPLPYQAAVVTLSDRCASGEREDKSGPLVAARLAEMCIRDSPDALRPHQALMPGNG